MLPSKGVTKSSNVVVERSLADAFASFTQAAGSLENWFGNLQNEVAGLRHQLELARQQLAAERANARRAQALAEAATLLAHEIRNPLGSLELFAGLLAADRCLGEDSRNIVGHVQAGLRTLSATVNNVLHFHNPVTENLLPTNLSNLVRMTLDFLKPMADQGGVELQFEDRLGEVSIAADPHRLQQVFLNLAMNSIRFMPNGGYFRTTGAAYGEVIELRISDNGPGIADAHKKRIFEPGFTTRPGSPGLGLAVCKKIVEQHGGSIRVEDVMEGAEFVLCFRR
jgi:signal transduction histidine kinase